MPSISRYLFAFLLFMALPAAPFAQAQETETADIPAVSGSAPEIDGQIDDAWSDVSANEIEHVLVKSSNEAGVEDEDDLSATWKAVWNKEALYFLAEVTDDKVVFAKDDEGNAQYYYDHDAVEFYIDLQNDGDVDEGAFPPSYCAYDTLDYEFVFYKPNVSEDSTATDDSTRAHAGTCNVGSASVPAEDVQIATTEDGYVVEAKISWSAFDVGFPDPSSNPTYGLDVHISDDDDPAGDSDDVSSSLESADREAMLSWAEDVDEGPSEEDDTFGYSSVFGDATLTGTPSTSDAADQLPQQSGFALQEAAPNPVRDATIIRYKLAEPVTVRLAVYDVLGRRVTTLVDRRQSAGRQAVRFDAGELPSGIYLYRLEAGSFSDTGRMIIAR